MIITFVNNVAYVYLLIVLLCNSNLLSQTLDYTSKDSLEFKILQTNSAKYSREKFNDISDYVLFRDSIFQGSYSDFLYNSERELNENFGDNTNRTFSDVYKEWLGEDIDNILLKYIYNWTRKSLLLQDSLNLKDLLIYDGLGKYSERMNLIKKEIKKILSDNNIVIEINIFNPRPPKNRLSPQDCKTFFILGRLSNHSYGNAIDVNPSKNPILDTAEWNFIEDVINMKIDRFKAKSKNEDTLKELWKDLVYANSKFIKNISNQFDSLKQIGISDNLIYESFIFKDYPCLEKYKDGFFNIPWDVIRYCLIEKNMDWGFTFEHVVDIHHFEFSLKK